LATVFSAIALGMAMLRGSTDYDGFTTWQAIAFYYLAGIAGGTVFGLLQPFRDRYVGRYLTAYLILFLVYGGGTSIFLPSWQGGDPDPVPLRSLLLLWAVLCLILAPLYVRVFRDKLE
jgi:hypothetical protein